MGSEISITVAGITVLFMVLGTPIAVALGAASVVALLIFNLIPFVSVAQQLFTGMESYILVAIPFFIFAGVIMEAGGIAKALIDFSKSFLGFSRGGLGAVNIFSSFIFGGISGSSVADTAAIGSIMIPSMVEEGYDKDYAAAITVISSTLAVIVPPSIIMLILGAVAEISIAKLLLGGILPGVLVVIFMMAQNYYMSFKYNYGTIVPFSFKNFIKTGIKGLPALGAPLIIIGGILTGFITPTESGGMAVVYSLIVSAFVYKTLSWKKLYDAVIKTAIITGCVVFVIGVSNLFTFILSFENTPQRIAEMILSISDNKYLALFVINIFLLCIGMIMDGGVAIILLVPLLFPVAYELGLDPIHFGVMFSINLAIGLVTPPFGVCLFSCCNIAELSMAKLVKASLPLYASLLLTLFIVTYAPSFVLLLPNLLK